MKVLVYEFCEDQGAWACFPTPSPTPLLAAQDLILLWEQVHDNGSHGVLHCHPSLTVSSSRPGPPTGVRLHKCGVTNWVTKCLHFCISYALTGQTLDKAKERRAKPKGSLPSQDRLGPGTLCCSACTWTNISLGNKIQRNYKVLRITAGEKLFSSLHLPWSHRRFTSATVSEPPNKETRNSAIVQFCSMSYSTSEYSELGLAFIFFKGHYCLRWH